MKKNELAAALNVARQVCRVDSLEDKEIEVIRRELLAFNLSDEENKEILDKMNELSAFRALEIIRDADEAVKKEVASLCIVAINADDDCSDKEIGAYLLVHSICGLPKMTFSEAKEHLKL